MSYYYLLINLAAFSIPFLAGFDKRLRFYHEWKFLFPAMIVTMLVFIPWDIVKTSMGVWGFNPDYLTGYYFFNLPLEELLFFIAIPYACLFTYHALKYLVRKDYLQSISDRITEVIIMVLIVTAVFNTGKTYTVVTFISTAFFLLIHRFVIRAGYLGRFYLSYIAILIPFYLTDGALTGLFTPEPVVWYDDTENLGIRLSTIPIEDFVYGLLLLLMNTTIYETLRSRTRIRI